MNNSAGVMAYLFMGFIGGAIGFRLKITGGTMIGSMLAVVLFNLIIGRNFRLPPSYSFIIQILIGIMVGASFSREIGRVLIPMLLPVLGSTLVLVSAGTIVSVILVKLGLLDNSTAFFSTSPGAMSVLLGFAGETDANLPIVLCFHIFRVFFIIITAPLVFRLMQKFMI